MAGELGTFFKQPVEVLDYDFVYADWLAQRNDTIASVEVFADAGIVVGDGTNGADPPSFLNGVVKAWLLGGEDKQRYKVTCIMTSTGGRIKSAEIIIQVKEI